MAEWWSGLVIAARKTNPRSISEPIMQPILNVCQKDDGLPTKINPDSLSEFGPVQVELKSLFLNFEMGVIFDRPNFKYEPNNFRFSKI